MNIFKLMFSTGIIILTISLTILMGMANILLGFFTFGAIITIIAAIAEDLEQ